MFFSSLPSICYVATHVRNRRKLDAETKVDNICGHKDYLFQESQAALQIWPVAALQGVQVLLYYLLKVAGLRHKKCFIQSCIKMNQETKGTQRNS